MEASRRYLQTNETQPHGRMTAGCTIATRPRSEIVACQRTESHFQPPSQPTTSPFSSFFGSLLFARICFNCSFRDGKKWTGRLSCGNNPSIVLHSAPFVNLMKIPDIVDVGCDACPLHIQPSMISLFLSSGLVGLCLVCGWLCKRVVVFCCV